MTILNTGNVGIGTSSPNTGKLVVADDDGSGNTQRIVLLYYADGNPARTRARIGING